MNVSNFQTVDIDVDVRGTQKQHKIVVYKPLKRVLSYLAVWLGKQKSYGTAFQYAKVMCAFCSFLVFHYNGDKEKFLNFWYYVNIETLTAWKTYRIRKKYSMRDKHGKYLISPSNPVIDAEVNIVRKFLDWVKNDMNLVTRWDGKRKKIDLAAKIDRVIREELNVEVVDASTNVFFDPEDPNYPIEGLRRYKQSQPNEYLNTQQIKRLLNSFSDKVWKFISATVTITGLRPHEALAVPEFMIYFGGLEFSADPDLIRDKLNKDSDAGIEHSEMSMIVFGKRGKERTVKVSTQDWLDVMSGWWPIYQKRKKLYKDLYGTECPTTILWLNKKGQPLYCDPRAKKFHRKILDKLQNAYYYVSTTRKKEPLSKVFDRTVDCYCLRHTYATNFVIDMVLSGICGSANDILSNIALQKQLADQMGHDEFDTTLKFYVDNAAVILMSYKGGSVHRFVDVREILSEREPRLAHAA